MEEDFLLLNKIEFFLYSFANIGFFTFYTISPYSSLLNDEKEFDEDYSSIDEFIGDKSYYSLLIISSLLSSTAKYLSIPFYNSHFCYSLKPQIIFLTFLTNRKCICSLFPPFINLLDYKASFFFSNNS